MLDRLRGSFIYVVAAVLPLAGLILAVARFAEGDLDEAIRLAAATVLGICVLALLFF